MDHRARLIAIRTHYERQWGNSLKQVHWSPRPGAPTLRDFDIFCAAPTSRRKHWTYATAGMGTLERPLEVHVFSRARHDVDMAEILTMVAWFHQVECELGLHHSVNFGRPVIAGSILSYGFLSLPYLDGSTLEHAEIGGRSMRFLWLIPISPAEREYKVARGTEALEREFESHDFHYSNLLRDSLV